MISFFAKDRERYEQSKESDNTQLIHSGDKNCLYGKYK